MKNIKVIIKEKLLKLWSEIGNSLHVWVCKGMESDVQSIVRKVILFTTFESDHRHVPAIVFHLEQKHIVNFLNLPFPMFSISM